MSDSNDKIEKSERSEQPSESCKGRKDATPDTKERQTNSFDQKDYDNRRHLSDLSLPSKLVKELHALLDEARFYVDYRGDDETDKHRLWVAAPQLRQKLGQPSRRPGQTEPDDGRIHVLEGDVLIIDISDGIICVIACRHSGGFGPGDYQNLWKSPQDAFDDVRTLLIERDIRMQAKEAGKKLHPRPSTPIETGSLTSLKELLLSQGFVLKDATVEVREATAGENSQLPTLEVNGGGEERAYVFLHPRGFWCLRSFKHEADRWFGDFEHYWASENEVAADVHDLLKLNSLRRRALNVGIEHAATHRQ